MAKENVKLDQIIKSLFEVSNKALIGIINESFNKDYNAEEVTIKRHSPTFIKENISYEVIEADIIISVNDLKYHIEFQTKNDKTMEIRMFEYAFYMAKQDATLEQDGIMTLRIPNQAVVFIEENSGIRDQKVRIVFPEGKEVMYDINTIRFWEYTIEEIKERQIYNMLPLIIFKHRKVLKKIMDNREKILEEKQKIKEEINNISKEIKMLIREHRLESEDVHKIALAITNLTEYLNSNYIKDSELDEEVVSMTKTLYDPMVEERGIQKGIKEGIKEGRYIVAKRLISKGLDIETVADMTELSYEEVEKLFL